MNKRDCWNGKWEKPGRPLTCGHGLVQITDHVTATNPNVRFTEKPYHYKTNKSSLLDCIHVSSAMY